MTINTISRQPPRISQKNQEERLKSSSLDENLSRIDTYIDKLNQKRSLDKELFQTIKNSTEIIRSTIESPQRDENIASKFAKIDRLIEKKENFQLHQNIKNYIEELPRRVYIPTGKINSIKANYKILSEHFKDERKTNSILNKDLNTLEARIKSKEDKAIELQNQTLLKLSKYIKKTTKLLRTNQSINPYKLEEIKQKHTKILTECNRYLNGESPCLKSLLLQLDTLNRLIIEKEQIFDHSPRILKALRKIFYLMKALFKSFF